MNKIVIGIVILIILIVVGGIFFAVSTASANTAAIDATKATAEKSEAEKTEIVKKANAEIDAADTASAKAISDKAEKDKVAFESTEKKFKEITDCTHCGNGFYNCPKHGTRVSTYRLAEYDPVDPPYVYDGVPLYHRDSSHQNGCK